MPITTKKYKPLGNKRAGEEPYFSELLIKLNELTNYGMIQHMYETMRYCKRKYVCLNQEQVWRAWLANDKAEEHLWRER
jgi:hypothetical protein